MAAAKQVTISNHCWCDHPPLLISCFTFFYPSFLCLFLFSKSFPMFLFHSTIFSIHNSISPSRPPCLLNPCIRKFLYFPGAKRVVAEFASGREQRQSVYICSVVLSLSRLINTSATICLSQFRSPTLVSMLLSHACMVRLVSDVRECRASEGEWWWMGLYICCYWYCCHHWQSLSLQDQGEAIAHTMTAQRSNARIEGLKAGTPYVVQVRARTVAGYGRYSSPADFSTNLQSMLLPSMLLHHPGT